jgi:hypothetical protein
MKIRSGFVSNSSSSSFVLISPADFNPFEVFENEDERKFMEENMAGTKRVILGQDALYWDIYKSDEGVYGIIEADGFEDLVLAHNEELDDRWEYHDNLFDKFYGAFAKSDKCFVNVSDC